ncbi:MAG: TrmB family transcriptional regulator, partial [Halorubrum sp.]
MSDPEIEDLVGDVSPSFEHVL